MLWTARGCDQRYGEKGQASICWALRSATPKHVSTNRFATAKKPDFRGLLLLKLVERGNKTSAGSCRSGCSTSIVVACLILPTTFPTGRPAAAISY